MKIEKIYHFLDKLSPFELQEEWDNSGLIVGSFEDEADRLCISLDLDSKIALEASPRTVFITHHPLIFKEFKKLDFLRYPANILRILVQKECSLIAMHTNIDKTHLGKFVTERVLGFKIEKSENFIDYFQVDKNFDEFVMHVKEKLELAVVKVVRSSKKVKTAAICVGSGGDFINSVDADCFICGDIKYHQAMMARENGMSLIDVGHFESERYFSGMIGEYLKNFPLEVIITNSKNPFEYK